MKRRVILLMLCTICTLMVMSQVPVTRNKAKKPTPVQTTPKPKPKNNNNAGKKPSNNVSNENRGKSTPTAYDVSFSCTVEGATLYIDGTNYGTPSGTQVLKTGNHSVKVCADGYEDYVEDICVNANSRFFRFNMKKKVFVVTQGDNMIFTVGGVSYTMVKVQGGTFTMGATSEQGNDADRNEKPDHFVTLSNYYIGETEVTQGLWEAVMGTNVRQQRDKSGFTSLSGEGSNYPMYYISWNECQEFINKLNSLTGQKFRLPTEAEWEFAARGGKKKSHYKYSGSNTLGDVAWYTDNSFSIIHPVKTKLPNALGIYDMSGNVWEWCEDWFGSYSSSAQRNPTGPSSGSFRVLRGGSSFHGAGYSRVSSRDEDASSKRRSGLGFRLAL